MVPSKVFLGTASSHAAIIGLSTSVYFDPAIHKTLSAYMSAKIALTRMLEYISEENPSVFTAALNPGLIKTPMVAKFGGKLESVQFDSGICSPLRGIEIELTTAAELPADFTVWLSSKEASFLDGRYVTANWDVDELKARAEEIKAGSLLTTNILGWPFSP